MEAAGQCNAGARPLIPADFIAEWRATAPWVQSSQVEQDLVLSRALVEIFRDERLAHGLAFRGGTALYKLHLTPPPRYSEDIDLVQTEAEPIGPTLDRLRARLDGWLGEPRRAFGEGRVTLVYRFASEDPQPLPLRLKVEINSREHFTVFGLQARRFDVGSRWFSGAASIQTYELDEMLGTKLRALYQRRKSRDLFDLWWAARRAPVSLDRIVHCFQQYLEHDGRTVSRAELEANLRRKMNDPAFAGDLQPLLTAGVPWDLTTAWHWLSAELLPLLPGEPWRGSEKEPDQSP